MQVASQNTPEKQNVLDKKAAGAKPAAVSQTAVPAQKAAVNAAAPNKTENNETSQYLKVLSRIESLLVQDKLPEAAIQGFVGAVKKQMDVMSDAEKQTVMNLPEMKALGLNDLEDLPEMIKDDLTNEKKSPALLKLLRQPQFASLMRTDAKPAAQTYSAPTVAARKPEATSPPAETAAVTTAPVNTATKTESPQTPAA